MLWVFVIAATDYLIDLSALLLRNLAKNQGQLPVTVTAGDNGVLAAIEKVVRRGLITLIKKKIKKKKLWDPPTYRSLIFAR